MRHIVFISLFFWVSACLAVQQTAQINNDLNAKQGALARLTLNIARSFPISKIQYSGVKRELGSRSIDAFDSLEQAYQKMSEIGPTFSARVRTFQMEARRQQAAWSHKQRIQPSDPEWEPMTRYLEKAEDEYASLTAMYKEYETAQTTFNQTIQHPDLAAYSQKLPRIVSPGRGFRNENNAQQNARVTRTRQTARQALHDGRAQPNAASENENDKYNAAILAQLERELERPRLDINGLAELARFKERVGDKRSQYGRPPAGTTGPSAQTLKRANAMIAEVIKPNVIDAAKTYAWQQRIDSGIANTLVPLAQGSFSSLLPYISADEQNTVDRIFQTRKTELLDELAKPARARIDAIMQSGQDSRTRLIQLVAEHKRFIKDHRDLLEEAPIGTLLDFAQTQRLALLGELEAGLLAEINAADSPGDLGNMNALVADADRKTPIVERITQAQAQRLKSMTAFKPTADSSQLTIQSFTAKGLNYETELTAIYLGDFKNSRLDPSGAAASMILNGYLYSFGRQCHQYLPANRVPIMEQECATMRTTRDGWGNFVSESCVEWVDVPTGLYADPVLYRASQRASSQAGMNMVSELFTGDVFASRKIVDDKLSLGDDTDNLVKMNRCDNAGLARFSENLKRFVTGDTPLRLPGGETLASVNAIHQTEFDADSLNLKALLDDLISENAQGWMMNRYRAGSVSGIRVQSGNRQSGSGTVSASYTYSAMGRNAYTGQVSLTFANDIPKCLFFSDAPQTCRSPSRRIINDYERGKYLN